MDTGLIFLGTEQAVEHVPAAPSMFWTAIRSPMSGGTSPIPRGKCTRAYGIAGRARLNFPAMRARSCASLPKAPPRLKTRRAAKTLVKPGDAFIIPQGARTVWRIGEYVKKYYLCVLDLEA